ncbi:MAG: flagellar protein [Spirochaetes bacterium]|nr:flagellar protein [Spirochaetota bacterium]
MKKWICLILVITISVLLSTILHAEEKTLIDFSLLKANSIDGKTQEEGTVLAPLAKDSEEYKKFDDHTSTLNNKEEPRKQHMETLLDFSGVVGMGMNSTDAKSVKVSLAPANWVVRLNSSAAFTENTAMSYALEWHTKANETSILHDPPKEGQAAQKPAGYTILGLRVKFPEANFNCWALISPPFDIPAYEDKTIDFVGRPIDKNLPENRGTKYENGYGVIKNISIIKRIKMRIYGLQFKNSIAILIKDDNFRVTEYHFPEYLDFDGWREISWVNPNYIENVANRELFIVPLYPRSEPHIKVEGFRIYRQGDQYGGDFVTYIKDVKVVYDLAILETEREIEHESAWGILEARVKEAKVRELQRIGDSQLLRYLEKQKQHKESQ